MRVSYTAGYHVPLPAKHPFPMGKFPALHELLLREHIITPSDVVAPRMAEWSDLQRVHTTRYLTALAEGTLTRQAERRMGLPWSPALVVRSRLAVQGTINAMMMALEDGIAANLAGGTHHAFADYGEGFCVLNDVAVGLHWLLASKWIRRALVLDLDVHQGNGTAHVLREDSRVFTCSIHGAKNFPFRKENSDLDIPLADGTADEDYLAVLQQTLPRLLTMTKPDLIVYLAGIDVMHDDRFGRLRLTFDGLYRRDLAVLKWTHQAQIPVCLLLSGGYAPTPEETANRHAQCHRAARDVYGFGL